MTPDRTSQFTRRILTLAGYSGAEQMQTNPELTLKLVPGADTAADQTNLLLWVRFKSAK